MYTALLVLRRRAVFIGVFVVTIGALAGSWQWTAATIRASQSAAAASASYKTPQEASPYVRFDMEGYDIITQHYWQKASDKDLSLLFQAALQKQMATTSIALPSKTRDGVAQMLASVMQGKTGAQKKDIAAGTLRLVLYNLAPAGRDQLLTQQAQTALHNEVNNVNPKANLYGDLGLQKGASSTAINAAYQQKSAQLAASSSPQAKQELQQVQEAHKVLSNNLNKQVYDKVGGLPTVSAHRIGSHTLYVDISRVAPATIQEFVAAVQKYSGDPSIDSMILDLRSNIGGSLDFAQYMLTLFLGPDQYAFDLFHQGDMKVQRTVAVKKMPELQKIREMAVLTNGQTQSTAELLSEMLRHDRIAYVVGTKTRGWGTVEHVYPITAQIDPTQKYAVLIVQYLTMRDDGKPIQGNGVTPNVDTSQVGWQSKLSNYFFEPSLISAIESAVANPPAAAASSN